MTLPGCNASRGFAQRVSIALFSVQPLCSLCLCGLFLLGIINHRDTENTEVAQRNQSAETLNEGRFTQYISNLSPHRDVDGDCPTSFRLVFANLLKSFVPQKYLH